jgi:hypothetical protein
MFSPRRGYFNPFRFLSQADFAEVSTFEQKTKR